MKDDELTEEDDLEPKAKTSKVVLILLVLNLVVSALATFKLMTASPAEASEEVAAEETDVPGPLHTFDPFVVNLNDVKNPRFLKIAIDAELRDDEVIKELDETRVRFARDAVMRYLSSLTIEDAMGEAAKTTIANEVVARLNGAISEGAVKRILFAEFVVQ